MPQLALTGLLKIPFLDLFFNKMKYILFIHQQLHFLLTFDAGIIFLNFSTLCI